MCYKLYQTLLRNLESTTTTDSVSILHIKTVFPDVVTDAKGMLECFDFSMEKMAFAFGVTLGELVGNRRQD